MSYETNPYYHPEAHGCEIVAAIEQDAWPGFDIALLLGDKEGNLWLAGDSGCSCPSPFEWTTFPDDFRRITTQKALVELERELSAEWQRYSPRNTQDVRDGIAKARTWLRNKKNPSQTSGESEPSPSAPA